MPKKKLLKYTTKLAKFYHPRLKKFNEFIKLLFIFTKIIINFYS